MILLCVAPYLVMEIRRPIIMTHPTKAIAPILLDDYRKVMVEKRGVVSEKDFFTAEQIKTCMEKVKT